VISSQVKTRSDIPKLLRKARRSRIESIGRGAAVVRLTASRSIRKRKKPSAAGRPPHTKRGQLRRGIRFAVDRSAGSAVIGPSVKAVGTSGAAHEFGGRYKGEQFDRRPFMGPALEKTADRLPKFWQASIKN